LKIHGEYSRVPEKPNVYLAFHVFYIYAEEGTEEEGEGEVSFLSPWH
jgi:hypothetical protein